MMSHTLVAGLLLMAATPAVPLPDEAKLAISVPQMAGTIWAGDGAVAFTIYHFEKDGTLAYSYNGQTFRNATWKQDGATVTFDCNDGFYQFRGTVRPGELAGKSWNSDGAKWDLKIKPQAAAKK